MARDVVWEHTLICRYNTSQNCNRTYAESCYAGQYCSKDPNKDRGKDLTSGQIKFLTDRGYSEEEVSRMSFTEAGNAIREIKQTSPKGFEKAWY